MLNNFNFYTFALAVILLAGVALNRFSKFLKMPILLCFLGLGVFCGQYGINIIPPIPMDRVQLLGEIALCFIIFTGGLQTSFSAIRSVFITGTILSTAGVILTALLSGAVFYLVFSLPPWNMRNFPALLLCGCIYSSTDAAAVFAILRGRASINPRLQSLLEYESGSNDPAAFLLTSVMMMILLSSESVSMTTMSKHVIYGIVWGLGAAAAVGFLIGVFGQWFYNWIQNFLEYNGLRFVVAIAIVLLCYSTTVELFHANSLMACYIAGITMGNLRFNFKQIFVKFHEGVSWTMQIVLYTLLGSFFNFRLLFDFGNRHLITALIVSLLLMFIVRPLVVLLCMTGSSFSLRERFFTGWVGIRGSAPIMLAALVLANVPEKYNEVAQILFIRVFTVVLFSILLQGSTIIFVARKLGLVLPYQEESKVPLEYEERSDNREVCQFTVSRENGLDGITLEKSGLLEANPILLMIKRGENFIQPERNTLLKSGDGLTFLGKSEDIRELHAVRFANESYSPPMTFRQALNDFTDKCRKHILRGKTVIQK